LLAARNIVKAWLFLGGFAALLTALGWWLGGLPLGSLFLVVALLMVSTLYWYGPRVILASLGARELLLAEAPLVHSSLERLAVAAGVDRPRLYLLPDGHPRAFAVGRGRSSAAVALSRGLMTLSRPAELEGLLAHELAHIRHRALLVVLAPVAASLVQVLLSPKREFAADAAGAYYCTSPHGLADALVRLEQAQELVSFQASPATEPLYTVNPFEPIGIAALFTTHPPIGERVERLRNFDPDWREKLRAA
jgi:heat shock protein HtpX